MFTPDQVFDQFRRLNRLNQQKTELIAMLERRALEAEGRVKELEAQLQLTEQHEARQREEANAKVTRSPEE